MKAVVSYTNFEKLDLRVGKVVKVEVPKWSNKLLRFEVDFGIEVGIRIIFSGVRKWYKGEDFLGKQFIFLINMTPKKMGEEESQGMMLMADTVNSNPADKQRPTSIPLNEPVGNGTVVR